MPEFSLMIAAYFLRVIFRTIQLVSFTPKVLLCWPTLFFTCLPRWACAKWMSLTIYFLDLKRTLSNFTLLRSTVALTWSFGLN